MLSFERTYPHFLAYDRLTPKMIKFLYKQYLLNEYIIQNNCFAVFLGFFHSKRNGLTDYGKYLISKNRVIYYIRIK